MKFDAEKMEETLNLTDPANFDREREIHPTWQIIALVKFVTVTRVKWVSF